MNKPPPFQLEAESFPKDIVQKVFWLYIKKINFMTSLWKMTSFAVAKEISCFALYNSIRVRLPNIFDKITFI